MRMSESSRISGGGPYSGVVFDFNGTLIWDNLFHEDAWIAFSKELGRPVDRTGYYRTIHGKTTRAIIEMLLGHEVSARQVAELSREKERIYREICRQNPQRFVLAPGVKDLLDELKVLRVPMTIATASEIENVEFFFDYFSLALWFEADRIVYDDGHIRNKPEPDIYLKAAANLGFPPQELVCVEDSFYGVRAAVAAGFGSIIVTGEDTGQHARLREHGGVDRFIDDFAMIDRSLFR